MVCTRSVNAVSRPGNTMVKPGSGGLAVLEHELELGQNHVPISTSGGPVFDNFPAGQIEHFAQGIIVGKAGLVFCDLPELAVEPLNDIGRVYDFSDLIFIILSVFSSPADIIKYLIVFYHLISCKQFSVHQKAHVLPLSAGTAMGFSLILF